jgi:transposase-like protein
MKTNETKVRFVEMRARGLSFGKISAELNTSPETLYRWQRSMRAEIEAKTIAEREKIVERFKLAESERLEKYCSLYQRVSEQVDKEYLDTVPAHHLIGMMLTLDRKISRAIEFPEPVGSDVGKD